jgi:hypothetical protein
MQDISRLLRAAWPFVVVPMWLVSAANSFAAEETMTLATTACDAPNLFILSGNAEDVAAACDGAAAARDFLGSYGLDVSSDIWVEILPTLGSTPKDNAAGCYLASKDRVLVLDYAAFLKLGDWCGIPIDRALYRALVTHEAAHAIAACNFKIPRPSIPAQEYIAYVTMMATMDAEKRDSVMSRFAGKGYETEQQMNTTIYLCDPMRFGVQAYRHFLRRVDGGDYLNAILSGKVLSR